MVQTPHCPLKSQPITLAPLDPAAAAATSSKAASKKSSSLQPLQRPEIHMFSSKSHIAEDSDDDDVELSSPDPGTKSCAKKRPLPDDKDVIEVEVTCGKRSSLCTLYDKDVKAVTKKVKKSVKKGEAAAVKMAKNNAKGVVEVVRGGRGGQAGGHGGKVSGASGRVAKSKAVITDSDSDIKVLSSDLTDVPLSPPSRPKPKPAYKGANSVITGALEIPMSAAAAAVSSQSPADMSAESSITMASETPIPASAPMLQDLHDIVSVANTHIAHRERGPAVSPVTSTKRMQQNIPPPANDIPLGTSLVLPQTLPAPAPPLAPPVAVQGDFFEGRLLPSGDSNFQPQPCPAWDPHLPYSPTQRNHRAFVGHRDPRLDIEGREQFRMPLHPPGMYHNGIGIVGESGWDTGGQHGDFHNQDRCYNDMGWDMGHQDDYREVRRPGREDAGWDMGGEEYQEVRRVEREEGAWAAGG